MIYIFIHNHEINKHILTNIREVLKQKLNYVNNYIVVRFENYEQIDDIYNDYKKFTQIEAKEILKLLKSGVKFVSHKHDNLNKNCNK